MLFIEVLAVIGVAGGSLDTEAMLLDLLEVAGLTGFTTFLVSSSLVESSDCTGDKSTKTKSFGLPGLFFGLLNGGLLMVNLEAAAAIFNELFKHSIDVWMEFRDALEGVEEDDDMLL
jgi:hypothetical protein